MLQTTLQIGIAIFYLGYKAMVQIHGVMNPVFIKCNTKTNALVFIQSEKNSNLFW